MKFVNRKFVKATAAFAALLSPMLRASGPSGSVRPDPAMSRAVEMVPVPSIDPFNKPTPCSKDGLINCTRLGGLTLSGGSPFSSVFTTFKTLPFQSSIIAGNLLDPCNRQDKSDLAQGQLGAGYLSKVSNLIYNPYLDLVIPLRFSVNGPFFNQTIPSRSHDGLGQVPHTVDIVGLRKFSIKPLETDLRSSSKSEACRRWYSVERSLFYTNLVNPTQQSDGSLSVPEDLSKTQLVKSPLVSQAGHSVLTATNGLSNFQLIVGQGARKDNVLHVCSQLAKLVALNSVSPVIQADGDLLISKDLSRFQIGKRSLDSQQSFTFSQTLLDQLLTASSKTPLSFELTSDFGLISVSVSNRQVSLFLPESDFGLVIGCPFEQRLLPLGSVHSVLEPGRTFSVLDSRRVASYLPSLSYEKMSRPLLDFSLSSSIANPDLSNMGQIEHVCRTDEELSMRTILNYLHGFLQNIAKNTSEFKFSDHSKTSTSFVAPLRPEQRVCEPEFGGYIDDEFQIIPSDSDYEADDEFELPKFHRNLKRRSSTPSLYSNKPDASTQTKDDQDLDSVGSVESGSTKSYIYRSPVEIKQQVDLLLSNPTRYYSSFKSFVNSVPNFQQEKSYLNDFVLMYQLDYQNEIRDVEIKDLKTSDAYNVVGAAISNQNADFKSELKQGLKALNDSKEAYSNALICSTCLYLSKSEDMDMDVSKIKNKFRDITNVELSEGNVNEGIFRLLALREQGYIADLNKQALDYIAHNKASTKYVHALCKSGLSIQDIANSLERVYPSEFHNQDTLISNLSQLFSDTRVNVQRDSLDIYSIQDCKYEKLNAVDDKDVSGFNAIFGTSRGEDQGEVGIQGKIQTLVEKLKKFNSADQIPEEVSKLVRGIYDDYAYIFERLDTDGVSEFSCLDLSTQNALPFWSKSLFDFMKAQFKVFDPIKTDTMDCCYNLESSIRNLLQKESGNQILLKFFSTEGAFRYTHEELKQLCEEYPDTDVSKNARALLDVEQKEANAKQGLVLNYINTVLEEQLLQENYPFSNSELGLLFLADQLEKGSDDRQRLIIYQEDGKGKLYPETYNLDDSSYPEHNFIRIHQAGINYSRLKKVS